MRRKRRSLRRRRIPKRAKTSEGDQPGPGNTSATGGCRLGVFKVLEEVFTVDSQLLKYNIKKNVENLRTTFSSVYQHKPAENSAVIDLH